MKKFLIGFILLVGLVGIVSAADAKSGNKKAAAKTVKISVGYENATTEPAAKAVEMWAKLVKERSNGSMELALFPNSALGKKTELIDQMITGEAMITVADGAFLAEYGVPDFGIFYAPFAFETWDEVWKVLETSWYRDLCNTLAKKVNIRVLTSNWIYGARDIISTKKVVVPADLAGLKMRVSPNKLSIDSFKSLGAAAIGMDMGEVYQALQSKTIDAVENPAAPLANRSFHEVAKYLCEDHHILATSMWICGERFFKTLTAEQQKILMTTADEAGLFNNELQSAATEDAKKKMIAAGVTITTPNAAEKKAWVDAAQKFLKTGGKSLGWSDGLYDSVRAAVK
ncbi:TRAP transporter substrate-binding protein DctP [Treponema parvum]|uniref:TRAP transporter substrate-binding protein DctP n=1 Tax=Treponema parvum TaxID=138851 RepID=A0A975EY55_9SPIR|nr:C4-dicarboxylate TRAP transporter substrate-binding protein [Treponema parvum]QTQ11003.1 TRAP transporter substrate-binding protein DctP [Treponema parvum]